MYHLATLQTGRCAEGRYCVIRMFDIVGREKDVAGTGIHTGHQGKLQKMIGKLQALLTF